MEMKSVMRWLCLCLVGAAAVMVTGCGGGGEGKQTLNSDSPEKAASVQGLVAVGVPVAGATITATCAGGDPVTVNADASGVFSFGVQRLVAPCVVRAEGGTVDGQPNSMVLYSVTAAFGRVNVTPVTTLLVAHLSGESPDAFESGFTVGGRPSKVSTATIEAASANLRQYLVIDLGLPEGAGLDEFNPVTGVFQATTNDVHDQLLEALTAKVRADGLSWSELEMAVSKFERPPCLSSDGFCWPVTLYKVLAEGRANDKGEPDAKFHEHDVDITIGADGAWSKSIAYKVDKGAIKVVLNFDVDVTGRGLSFYESYRPSRAPDCGYALPEGQRCYEALYGAALMVCGAAAGDDFVMLPAEVVSKVSDAEVKKTAVEPLKGLTFDRIQACEKQASRFVISPSGQVTDESDPAVTGLIGVHIGKDWSGKQVDRKFWKVSNGTRSKFIGIESGTKNGQPHFVMLVQR